MIISWNPVNKQAVFFSLFFLDLPTLESILEISDRIYGNNLKEYLFSI